MDIRYIDIAIIIIISLSLYLAVKFTRKVFFNTILFQSINLLKQHVGLRLYGLWAKLCNNGYFSATFCDVTLWKKRFINRHGGVVIEAL